MELASIASLGLYIFINIYGGLRLRIKYNIVLIIVMLVGYFVHSIYWRSDDLDFSRHQVIGLFIIISITIIRALDKKAEEKKG